MAARWQTATRTPFINSLTHDSIIVQIPLLHGKINNRLDKVLSVFDQTLVADKNQHVINLDGKLYEDDPDMMHLLHRLGLATMNADLRQEMNDEDEYFSAIEDRDTLLMEAKAKLSDLDAQLSDVNSQLSDVNSQLSDANAQIRSMAQAMYHNGVSLEVIAQSMNCRIDDLKALLGLS